MTDGQDSATHRLAAEVVIVTGGTGGIGWATCQALAREGATVVVADVDEEKIASALASLRQAGGPSVATHLGAACDVRDESSCQDLVDRVLEHSGRIDGLVTCAGILRKKGTPPKPLVEVGIDEWEDVIDTNLKGVFLTNRAVLRVMVKQQRGTIVNISSISGIEARAHDGPYCASKFGVVGLSKAVAEEVRRHGVRVQSILPAAIDTPLWEQNRPVPPPPDALPPERVAEVVVFVMTQPQDTLVDGIVIAPLGAKRGAPAGARKRR